MPEADETIVPTSQVKLALVVLVSTALGAAGLYLLQMDSDRIPAPWDRADIPWIHGLGLGIFFGFLSYAMVAMRKLLKSGPGLSLTPEGLIDNSHAIPNILVPWPEIAGLDRAVIRGRRVLVVRVRHPEKYLLQGAPLRRITNRANLSKWGGPIVIATGTLTLELDELEHLCRHYLERYGSIEAESAGSVSRRREPVDAECA